MKSYLRYRLIGILSVLGILFLGSLAAQTADLTVPDNCKKTLTTVAWMPADAAEANPQQLSIWYDFARDPYTKAVHVNASEHLLRKAVRYYWMVVLNDKVGTFKIAYSKLADSYIRLNEPDSALLAVYTGLAHFEDYQTLNYYGAQVHQAKGDDACAAAHYRIMLATKGKKDPDRITYLGILAKLYEQMDDERAIEAQQEVVELDPGNPEAGAYLARLMEKFGLDPMDALRASFKGDTTHVGNAKRYGKAAYEAGYYKQALQAYRAALLQSKGDVESLNYMARSYEGLNQLNNSKKAYKTLLGVDPQNQNALCALASLEGRQGNFVSAFNYLNKAKRIKADYGLIYMVTGEVYEQSVTQCSNERSKQGFSYDDKLMYELARKAYRRAAQDPSYAMSANRRYEQLEPFVRTKEDMHMHSNRSKINTKCYQWVSQVSVL